MNNQNNIKALPRTEKNFWDKYEINGKKMRCKYCRLLLLICPDCRLNHSEFICDQNECPSLKKLI